MTASSRKTELLTAGGTGLYAACALGDFNRLAHEVEPGPILMYGLFGAYVALGALRLAGRRPDPTAVSSWARAGLVFLALLLPLGAASEGRVVSPVGWWLAGLGAALGIVAVLALGSSFDVVPAVRDIVSTGPYRVIRHPGVTALFLMTAGWLLVHWNVQNGVVLGVTLILGILTAILEEDLLRRDGRYVEYSTRVRWRFIPGVA